MKEDREEVEEYFDYVMICNGHYTLPNIPDFEGKQNFKGIQFHMHELRKMESKDFDDKNILIVGAWISAIDLIINIFFRKDTKDLVNPKKVFITGRSTKLVDQPGDFSELQEKGLLEVIPGNISKINENKVIFGDGSEQLIDTIIYATGYKYCIPFIDPEDKIVEFSDSTDRGFYFGPLYKRMFCINEPNLFFIGMVEKAPLIHPAYERQILLAKEKILGLITLPSKEEMLADLDREIRENEESGESIDKFFRFNTKGYSYYDYNRDLEKLTSMEVDTVNYQRKFIIIHNLQYSAKPSK